jgi:threonine synthase
VFGAAYYFDPGSGQQYSIAIPRSWSHAHQPLLISELPGITRDSINEGEKSIWRYSQSFPLNIADPVTLGEGSTPMLSAPWLGNGALIKLDYLNPTGSFKDRGSSVLVSALKSQGIRHLIEDSSGNGASSIAAYSAAAGISATIFAPENTSDAKLAQAVAHGAAVVRVPGGRSASQDAAIAAAEDTASPTGETGFYAGHNWQPLFLEGTKTLAYEIWEDLAHSTPDCIVMPVGAGSSLIGLARGFNELKRRGEIASVPRLFAAQPRNCSPLDAAFSGDTRRSITPTIAEGTAIAQPLRLHSMLSAVGDSNGATVAVSEQEIASAHTSLAQHGLYAEPTSAVAVAGYQRLCAAERISPADKTVILLTGSGLKNTPR